MTNPTITEITMWENHNYVDFSDTDSRSDYFNGYCLGVHQTIEWINREGGDRIIVRFGNGVDCTKYRKRLAAICKNCGYSWEGRQENVRTSDGFTWTRVWLILAKIPTSGEGSFMAEPAISVPRERRGKHRGMEGGPRPSFDAHGDRAVRC